MTKISNLYSLTNYIFADSVGNIGVGTATPNTKLQVNGTDLASFTTNSSYGSLFLQGGAYTGSQVQAIDFGSSSYTKPLGRIGVKVGSNGSSMHFGTSNGYTTGITNTALTIDYLGNVGIGTTPLGVGSSKSLEIGSRGTIYDNNDNFAYVNNGWNDGSWKYKQTGFSTILSTNDGSFIFSSAPSGTQNSVINYIERVRINPSGYLRVSNSGTFINGVLSTFNSLEQSGTTDAALYAYSSYVGNGNVILARGYSNNTSGSLFLGYSSSIGDYTIRIFSNGNIQNTNGSYGSLSDIKLKENIVDTSSKLNDLLQVRVVNYNLISNPELKQIGVIAQELEEIFPGMVEEVIDRDEFGRELGTKTKSVKYSVFVPMLIKAVQEQQVQIQELSAKVTALENK